jgi:hypothetical protein
MDEEDEEDEGDGENISAISLQNLNIYPNPVNDKLYIETQTQIQTIEIYDIYGRHQVAETPRHQGDLSIDVLGLKSGVYFVKIVTDKGEVTKLFIKK